METILPLVPSDLLLDVSLLDGRPAVKLVIVVWVPICFQNLADIMLGGNTGIETVQRLGDGTTSLVLCRSPRAFQVFIWQLLQLYVLHRGQTWRLLSGIENIIDLMRDFDLMIDQPLRSNGSAILPESVWPHW